MPTHGIPHELIACRDLDVKTLRADCSVSHSGKQRVLGGGLGVRGPIAMLRPDLQWKMLQPLFYVSEPLYRRVFGQQGYAAFRIENSGRSSASLSYPFRRKYHARRIGLRAPRTVQTRIIRTIPSPPLPSVQPCTLQQAVESTTPATLLLRLRQARTLPKRSLRSRLAGCRSP